MKTPEGIRVLGRGEASLAGDGLEELKALLRQPKSWRLMDNRSKLLVLSGLRALKAAGRGCGIRAGEGIFGVVVEMEEPEPGREVLFRELEPLWLLQQLPNMPAAHLAIEAGLQGPSQTLAPGDGGQAAGQAERWLRRGEVKTVMVGWVHAGRAGAEIWERA